MDAASFFAKYMAGSTLAVTPHVGVWIETAHRLVDGGRVQVTPHVGVWIETCKIWTRYGRLEESRVGKEGR